MLKKLGFKNYRSFIKRTDLEFAPLTILVGPNSTGKSSIMRLIRWLFSRPDELIWNWNADGQDLTPGDPTPLEISVDYSVIEQLYPEIIQPNFHFATKLIFDWHNNEPVMPIFTDYSFFCDEPSIDMQVDLIVGSPEYAAGNLFKWPINIERSFQSIRWENLFRRNHEEVRQLFTEIFNVFYGFKNGDYFDPILYPKNYRSGIPGINILKSAIHEPEWLPEFFSEAISPGEDELDLFENLWDIVKETGVELVPFLQQKGGEEWKDFAKSKDPGDNLKKILPNNAYRETDYPFEEINWEDDDIANFFLEMIGQLNGLREIEEKLGSPLEAKLYFRLANRWAILTFFDKLRRRLARLRLSAIASVSRAHEQNLAVKFYAAHREELTRDLALSFKNDMIRKVREIQR
ncbi:MAG TPA: AAA family ATPase, partial [Nitrospirales bacterium]|nr:AAA family ATPase [Nitrospirales bacterium]